MFDLRYKPGEPIADLVDYLWITSDAPPHSMERIVPSGTSELVINLHENEIRIYDPVRIDHCRRLAGAVVSGAFSGFFVIDTREHSYTIGAHFKPGCAHRFFGFKAIELADSHVDLETFWGADAGRIRDRLCSASSPTKRFQLLEQALISHLLWPSKYRGLVEHALHDIGSSSASVRDVANETGLSHRHFIEVFSSEVGLTPKVFCRIRRFQKAAKLAVTAPAPSWGEIALDCGYFDQSHMIRDFQSFSGFTPADYLCHVSERIKENHLALA